MPVELVGGLFPRNQLAPRQAYAGRIDLDWIRDLARAHEHAGFDRVLIANGGGDPILLAAFAAAQTERLGFMIAHRPGLVAPTVAARAFATLDQTTKGRIRLHAITGHAAEPEHGDGLIDKPQRYARADEYLEVVRRTWSEERPFDFEGRFYQVKGAFSPIKPLRPSGVPISLGGSSDAAYEVAVKHTDLYALWAEPLEAVAARIAKLRAVAAAANRPVPRISLSARLIIAPTEALAWEKAERIAAELRRNWEAARARGGDRGQSGGGQRQLAFAAMGERFDRCLYFGTSTAIGGGTDSTSLVGTPDTVVAALLDYYDLGVTTFLNRGYDPLHDAIDYGHYVYPTLRDEIRRRDEAAAARDQ
jgi:alkanesulfonate monooxygenase